MRFEKFETSGKKIMDRDPNKPCSIGVSGVTISFIDPEEELIFEAIRQAFIKDVGVVNILDKGIEFAIPEKLIIEYGVAKKDLIFDPGEELLEMAKAFRNCRAEIDTMFILGQVPEIVLRFF